MLFSVPVAGSLKRPNGWMQADDSEYVYYIFRYHFFIKKRQSELPPQMGERFRTFSSPSGESTKIVESVTISERTTDFSSTLTSHYSNSIQLADITTSIAANIGFRDLGGAKAEIKGRLSETLENGILEERVIQRADHVEKEHTIMVERNIPENITKNYVVPAWYQQWSLDVYISFVDYLFVNYERKGLQIRRRRIKTPEAAKRRNREDHSNLINMDNKAVCCIKYWQPLAHSRWVEEDSYHLNVEYPDDIIVSASERTHHGHSPRPLSLPSLYELSEKAFPHRFDRDEIARRVA